MDKIVQKIGNALVFLLFTLLPVFFLPFFNEVTQFPKSLLLVFSSLILLSLFIVRVVVEKEVNLNFNKTDLLVLFFTLSQLVSLLLVKNKIDALFFPGTAGAIFALFILYLILKEKTIHFARWGVIAGGLLLSLSTIIFFLLPSAVFPIKLTMMKITNSSFAPSGGVFISSLYLGAILIYLFSSILNVQKEKQFSNLAFYYLIPSFLILIGLGISIFQSLVIAKPVILPVRAGWIIMIEIFKNARSAFFGIGPGNFLNAFLMAKPAWFNMTPIWNIGFNNSSNWYFNLLTETGVIGFLSYLLLIWHVLSLRKNAPIAEILPLLAIFILGIFFPGNLLLLVLTFFFLAKIRSIQKDKVQIQEKGVVVSTSLGLLLLVFIVVSTFFLIRITRAELAFVRSMVATTKNDADTAYRQAIEAIRLNPYRDLYHRSYSRLNLILAQGLTQQKEIPTEDREKIAILLNQAIREGKAAVAANPQSSQNWQNLGEIYRALINVANGADSWTISALTQAVNLSPSDPLLRLSLGGVYYALGDYETSQRIFETAVLLKPDWANSHYNLAWSLKQQKKNQKAVAELEETIKYLAVDSPDYTKVKAELDEFKKSLTTGKEKEGETLQTPAPLSEPIEPPIALPEEAAPPATESAGE